LTLEPSHFDAAYYLARLLLDQGRLKESIAPLQYAIKPLSDRIGSVAHMAMELGIRGMPEGDELLQKIVKHKGNDAKALAEFAQTAYWYGVPRLSLDYISQARSLADSIPLRIGNDLMLPLIASCEDEIEFWVDRFRANVAALVRDGVRISDLFQPIAPPPHYPLFCFGIDTRELYTAAATAWQGMYPDLNFTAPHCETWRCRPLRKRLRVGFLTQPTFPLVWGMARELDRERFEVIHLYEDLQPPACTDGWQGAADKQVAIPHKSVRDAQRVIADQHLDVLIHMPYTSLRYFLSHARLAPVQCVLCEPCYTDGVANLDYYVSWAPAEPRPVEQWYNCAVALMKRPPYWLEREYFNPAALQRKDFALPQGARWYLCPNTPLKLLPRFDALLVKILAEDPDAIVILLRGDLMAARVVEQRLRRSAGSLADRVHILPTLPADRAHALLMLADALIDSWPLGGMSSSWTALHGGIPTVTLPADIPFGCWLASMYEAIGVTDLIATDEDDFVRLAIRLANDPQWRQDIATRIKARNAIFIEDRLAVRELEEFLTSAVGAAHRGEPPRSWKDNRFTSDCPSSGVRPS
jgi:hypothetical protein